MKPLRSAAVLALLGVCSGAPASRAIDWPAVGQEAAELLSDYVRIDTSNPPGNEHAAAVYLKRFFDAEGIEARLFTSAPGRSAVVARLPANRPDPAARGPILLLSHSDVVPADPRAWSFPPFSGAIEDGVIYGRGTLDDKGHGVAQALGLALLHRSGATRARDLVLCASPAEETEGENVGVEWLIENHWEALGPPVGVWNEGGVSTRNAIIGDRVVNAIATSEKQALWITLVAEGEGGHGSQPDPAGAIEILAAALARVRDSHTPPHATGTVQETFSRVASVAPFPQSLVLRFAGNPLGIRLVEWALRNDRVMRATIHDTIAMTELRAGIKHNVIPRRAEASLDIRLLPDTDAEMFLERLRRVIADPRVRIEDVPDPLPPTTTPSPTDHELFRAIEAEMARELPDSLTIPLQTTGGSDSKFFREAGVPSYGYLPAVISGERVASIHGLDERIPAEELQRAVRVTYGVLRRLVE